MAQTRKTPKLRRPRQSLKRRSAPQPVPADCRVSLSADDEAGVVGTATGSTAVFSDGRSRRHGRELRPAEAPSLLAGDEIIQTRSPGLPPVIVQSLCIELPAEHVRALAQLAASAGFLSASDFVRSLVLARLSQA
jgi:hypothetical protein